jgi:hypothetical protein
LDAPQRTIPPQGFDVRAQDRVRLSHKAWIGYVGHRPRVHRRTQVGPPDVRRRGGFVPGVQEQFDPLVAAFQQYLVQPQRGE